MAKYIDAYVIPVSKRKLAAYRRMALLGKKVWLSHGALEYRECVGDDLAVKYGVPFPRQMKLKAGETVIYSWIVFKSKAHRNAVNEKAIKDPRMNSFDPKNMPFDFNRMVVGGFKVLVEG